jgi:hypothetical protein
MAIGLGRDRFERRAYRAIKDTLPAGSIVYPPERNTWGQYLLWLTEAEANRLGALRRGGESYGEVVIRLAKAQDWLVEVV